MTTPSPLHALSRRWTLRFFIGGFLLIGVLLGTTALGGNGLMEVFTGTAPMSDGKSAIALIHALAHVGAWLLAPPLLVAGTLCGLVSLWLGAER